MPLSLVPVTGAVNLPDGSLPAGTVLVWRLTRPDNEDGIAVSDAPFAVALDGGGLMPAGWEVWRNTRGSAGSSYVVDALVAETGPTGAQVRRQRRLGVWQVGEAATYTIGDLQAAAVPAAPGFYRVLTEAELDTAISDAIVAERSATATLTGKSLTAPVVTGTANFAGLSEAGAASGRAAFRTPLKFASRALMVTWLAAGNVVPNGEIAFAGGLSFIGVTGSTVVPDLPGVEPLFTLTPAHFGAVGISPLTEAVPTVDESQSFYDMFMAMQTLMRPIAIPARRYLLDAVSMPRLDIVCDISMDRAGRLYAGENYRGPMIWIDGQLMSASMLPVNENPVKISGVVLVASRKDSDDVRLPEGCQHGFVVSGRNNRISFVDCIVDGFVGWGTATGYGGSTAAAYIGESHWRGHLVMNSGVGDLFAAWEIIGTQGGSRSNNLFHYGCFVSFGPSVSMRMRASRGVRALTHMNFYGLQMHGQGVLVETEGFDPTGTGLLEIDGCVNDINIAGLSMASNETDQYGVVIRNSALDFVTLAADAVVTTSGSATVQISLPALATSALVTAQVQTVEGSPLVGLTWPDGPSRPAVGDYVTLDTFSGGVRTSRQIAVNGLTVNVRDMQVLKVDGQVLWVLASSDFATSTGISSTAVNQTLSRTYNIGVNTTGVSFDERSNGGVIASSLAVGGVGLTGFRRVIGMTNFNVFTATFTDIASSSATSAFSPVPELRIDTWAKPQDIRLDGVVIGEGHGVLVDAGTSIDLNLYMSVTGTELTVTENIFGPVRVGGRGGESRWTTDIAANIRHLVSGDAGGTSHDLPLRADAVALTNGANHGTNERTLRRRTNGATAVRLTEDGETAASTNVWAVTRAGLFQYSGTVSALQVEGASGTVGDWATWAFTAVATFDGTTFAVASVNGSAPGSDIAPTESAAGATTWRLNISADDTWDAPNITGAGEASHTIEWNLHGTRVDTYRGGEITASDPEEPEEE